ncbi:MAG: hypothetical protein R6X08_06725, partial [Desulfosalsimonadaceae bacterium]
MRKALTLLMAAAMVIGFTGMSAAQDTCMDPLEINRGCETEQQECYPFDYENLIPFGAANYCSFPAGKDTPKAIFSICDCDFAPDLSVGDVLDVRLEILVNGETGENGAYWAQNVVTSDITADVSEQARVSNWPTSDIEDNCMDASAATGIGLKTASSESSACSGDCFGSAFVGDFVYKDVDGNTNTPGKIDCAVGKTTIIEPASGQLGDSSNHGYEIQDIDADVNNSEWAIDIPAMWFDSSEIDEGDTVSVEICITQAEWDGSDWNVSGGSICGGCGCCETFELGTITCCEAGTSYSLVYPYVTPMNDANWWYGMVITNLSGTAGEANITIFESDGDTDSTVVSVPANGQYV